jgi:hypothetical protein
MSQFVFSSGEGVRGRTTVQAGQNRGLNTDHSADKFGSLAVINKAENARGVSYIVRCEICGCTGQRITQAQLNDAKFVPVCANVGCGQQSAPRTREASVQIRQREDVVMSPRQRAEAAASQAAREAFEKNGGE